MAAKAKNYVKRNTQRNLRILFVSEYFYPRAAGGEVWSWELCKELARRGHQVTVLTTRFNSALEKKEKREGVTILRPTDNHSPIGERAIRYFRLKSFNSEVKRYVLANKPHIIHTMAYGVNDAVSSIAKEAGIPSITSVHSYFGKDWRYEMKGLSIILQLLEKRILRNDESRTMHVPSKYLQQRINNDIGKKTAVIPNWLPERFPKPQRLPKGALLFVGSLEPVKDPLACVAVAKRLDAPLFVIGKGSLEGALIERAKDADIELAMLGEMSHEETLAYIGGAAAVIVPSVTESFSLVALEAVAQGTPVIGNMVGIIPSLPGTAKLDAKAVPKVSLKDRSAVRKAFSKGRAISSFEALYREAGA